MEFEEFKKNLSILIVDDNEDNIFTLQRRLQRDGYNNLTTAKSGETALQIIKDNKIDLLLLDIMMPGLSGYDVLTELKEKIVNQEIIVLMVSAADSIESVTQCIKAGADDFLPKPFNPQILKARIGSCVEKRWRLYTEKLYREQIELERSRFLEVLNAVFPPSIVKEMTETNTVKPKSISNVAVLFADIVSFTNYSETHEKTDVLQKLEVFIEICESAAGKYHVEKIKTIGDSFMATAGMLQEVDNPVLACVKWGSEVIKRLGATSLGWQVRVSVDIGDVICGIVGNREYLFDVWGRCVNTAARIETVTKPGKIYVSEEAWNTIKDVCTGTFVEEFNLKGKEKPTKVYEVDLLNVG